MNMKCKFEPYGIPDTRGWIRKRCVRGKCKRVLAHNPSEPSDCHAPCKSLPLWHEFGEWVAIVLGLVGVTPSRWGWVWWKLGLIEAAGCSGCEARKAWLNTFGGRLSRSKDWQGRLLYCLLVRRPTPVQNPSPPLPVEPAESMARTP